MGPSAGAPCEDLGPYADARTGGTIRHNRLTLKVT
jgi:hypothetical protein